MIIKTKDVKPHQIPPGLYSSAKELFKRFEIIKLELLRDKKVQLTVPNDLNVEFENGLRDILGFKNNIFASGKYISDYHLDLSAGISELFIYLNCIEEHRIGDISGQCLRIIPISGEKGEQIERIYSTPLYFPTSKQYINTIELEIRSTTGEEIVFTRGKTIAVLSFKLINEA